MTYLLALDQGTSSSRSIVFDGDGAIVASAQREFPQLFPQPGWVEHDPFDLWNSQLQTAREALAKAGIGAAQLSALGIASQRETTLVWERAGGRPVYNAIVWQDRRCAAICDALRQQGLAAEIRDRTGLVLDPYFSGGKLRWMLDNVPGLRARATRGELLFGTVDSWLTWQLTGGRLHVTDVSNASRTMLWNIHRQCWDADLLDWLRIPAAMLPQVHPSSHVYGQTDGAILGAPVTIGGIAGDQQAALFGQACFTPGMAKNTYGTGCFMLMHTGAACARSEHGLISTVACQTAMHAGTATASGATVDAVVAAGPQYALEGSVFIGGAVVQWLRDGLKAIQTAPDIEQLAASVPDSAGVVFVPSFTGLGAPYWNPAAKGAIVGLSRGSGVAHIARAALESIAFQSAALLDAMARDAIAPIAELRVDGGAAANNLLLQFQSDLLGIPVVRPQITETTALGAAYLAGLATGVFADTTALTALWRAERRFLPRMQRSAAQARMASWEQAVRQVSPAA